MNLCPLLRSRSDLALAVLSCGHLTLCTAFLHTASNFSAEIQALRRPKASSIYTGKSKLWQSVVPFYRLSSYGRRAFSVAGPMTRDQLNSRFHGHDIFREIGLLL